MKFAVFTTLTLAAFVGSGLPGAQSYTVQLTPADWQVKKPIDYPFKVQCKIVPFNRALFYSLSWLGPTGDVIASNRNGLISTFRYNNVFYLSFRKPATDMSGSYVCFVNHRNTFLSSQLDVEFIETSSMCPNGSYLSEDGKRCLFCPLKSYTASVGARSSQECVCLPGFEGDPHSGIPCSDIDECQSENRCNHLCHNTEGSYECSCHPGYVLLDRYRCEGCRKNSFKSDGGEFCTDCPPLSVTDGPGKASIADCKCLPGYSGDPSRYVPCTDIDECLSNNLGCSNECVNTPGSAHCSCPNGYKLDVDGRTCIDVNECLVNNGGCDGECENFEGGHRCMCGKGYESSNFYSCDDIDECASNNGGCGQICNNFRGGYFCSCRDGFRLGSDQKSCVAYHCPRVPLPQHSIVKCYKRPVGIRAKNEIILDVSEYYPNGTTCYVECGKGYKSSDVNGYIQCLQNGEWSGELPKCIVQTCSALQNPEHGQVKPAACRRGPKALTRCTFGCRRGYKLKGIAMFRCGSNKKWISHGAQPPVCEPVGFAPDILCSEDITAVLEVGRNWTSIIVPGPQTKSAVKRIDVFPVWIKANTGTKFPVGSTDITFTARSAVDNNLTSSCSVTVNVIDEEPPSVLFCPESFTVTANGSSGVIVDWAEPVFADNVMVHAVTENMKPGAQLQQGVYRVTYFALDAAGNEAVCEFSINVTSKECGFLNDPANGKVNCEDWAFGILCIVICDDGYALYPPEPFVFSCDDSGAWEPSDVVQDCMRTVPSFNMTCPDGFELTTPSDSDSDICVECPSYLPWSEDNRTCNDTNVN